MVHRTLSSGALDALKEFYAERDAREKKFEDLKAVSEENAAGRTEKLSMEAFQEDWNESQFWVGRTDVSLNPDVAGSLCLMI